MSYIFESWPVPSEWWPSKLAGATMQQTIDVSTLSPPIEASQFASLLVTIEPSGASELSIIDLSVAGTVVTVTETGGQPRRVYTLTFDAALTNGETQSWIIRQRIAPVLPTDQPSVVPDAAPGTPSVWPPYYSGLMASGADVAVIDTAGWPASTTPAQGWTYSSGAFAAPVAPTPTLAQQAGSLLGSGLTIASTSTPALDGTYATTSDSQQHIQAEVTAILLNGTFADGSTSLAWLDVAGDSHTFDVAQFKAFATAVAAFVSGCLRCVNGQSTTLPSASATIA